MTEMVTPLAHGCVVVGPNAHAESVYVPGDKVIISSPYDCAGANAGDMSHTVTVLNVVLAPGVSTIVSGGVGAGPFPISALPF